MWGDIIGDAIDALVKYGFQFFAGQMDKRNLVAQGQAAQAATETATSLNTETKIAQAETDTDRSVAGMEAAAKDGKF